MDGVALSINFALREWARAGNKPPTRTAIFILCLLCVPLQGGCSLNSLFNSMFDNPHAGGNGSREDRRRTAIWESRVMDENSESNASGR
jgi:hypothetical protein